MKKTTTNLGGGWKRDTTRYNSGHGHSIDYKPGIIFRHGKIRSTSKW